MSHHEHSGSRTTPVVISDKSDTMVVTFDEVPAGMKTGSTKRQYWMRDGKSWKIFFEGSI